MHKPDEYPTLSYDLYNVYHKRMNELHEDVKAMFEQYSLFIPHKMQSRIALHLANVEEVIKIMELLMEKEDVQ